MRKIKGRVIAIVTTGLLAFSGVAMAGSLQSPDARVGLARPTDFQGTVSDVFVSGGGCGGGGTVWAELKGADGPFYVSLAAFDRDQLASIGFKEGDTVTVSGYRETVKDDETEYTVVTPVGLKSNDKSVKPVWTENPFAKGMMGQGSGNGMMGASMMNPGMTGTGAAGKAICQPQSDQPTESSQTDASKTPTSGT